MIEFIKDQCRIGLVGKQATVNCITSDRIFSVSYLDNNEYGIHFQRVGMIEHAFTLSEKSFTMLLQAMLKIDSSPKFGGVENFVLDESCFDGDYVIRN